MAARVVNVRTQTDPSAFLYVGRRCKHPALGWLQRSYFANPFKVAPRADRREKVECLGKYRRWLLQSLATDEGTRMLSGLAQMVRNSGKPLGCWCGDYPADPHLLCHAVVLAEQIDLFLARSDSPPEIARPLPECPGHGRGGTAEPCCGRAGVYNGYGSDGPPLFHCPASCSCHD
jgi:hypothetical protein